jgi:hypothetical protein
MVPDHRRGFSLLEHLRRNPAQTCSGAEPSSPSKLRLNKSRADFTYGTAPAGSKYKGVKDSDALDLSVDAR